MISRYRSIAMLMSAVLAASSAGATAAAFTPAEPAPLRDGQIKLVHAETAQECVFDDQGAADKFLADVSDPDSWMVPGSHKVVNVDLNELHAQLAADKAADTAPEILPGAQGELTRAA